MKNVFIWYSYGSIEVYDCSNIETVKQIYSYLCNILNDYGYEEQMKKFSINEDKIFSDANDEYVLYMRTIESIMEFVKSENYVDHIDPIEPGTGFYKLKNVV